MGYLKKMERQPVVEFVVERLTEGIRTGDLKPGDRIPTEEELVRELGVARNSVREAVKILVNLGVLEIRRAEGTYVTRGFGRSLLQPVIYGILLNQDRARELLELRGMLEHGILHLASRQSEQAYMEGLMQRAGQLEIALRAPGATLETVSAFDDAFHRMVANLGVNEMAGQILATVLDMTKVVRENAMARKLENGLGNELYEPYGVIMDQLEQGRTEGLYEAVMRTCLLD